MNPRLWCDVQTQPTGFTLIAGRGFPPAGGARLVWWWAVTPDECPATVSHADFDGADAAGAARDWAARVLSAPSDAFVTLHTNGGELRSSRF